MAIERIDLELIHDNPYQARSTYHRKDIDDLAHSIKTHGLLQVPPGRRKDGNVELGFGHLRKRAFAKLAKKDPEQWGKMPIDIRHLSDEQMALFALEENLKRRDISPLETARAVDKYLNSFLAKTETELAGYLNMTKGTVSNMRRVLRLPEKILEKIDEGRINFTQGRELIILEKLENSEELMRTAIRGIRTEGMGYGHANTVEGMQASVHGVVENHCRPLDKQWEGYRWDILFDTRAAGCLECDKMIRTHPTKSATAHWCLDDKCWDRHQEEHREKASATAKARMEEDILKQAAQSVTEVAEAGAVSKWKPSPVIVNETGFAIPLPCDSCAKAETCDRTYFHVATDGSSRLVCEEKVKVAPEEVKEVPPEIPEDILALAREKAGTRAEVLDVNDIVTKDYYRREVKSGYIVLKGWYQDELRFMDDPEECTERCTHGFHFGFDSKAKEGPVFNICTDTKCAAKKKAAFTRAKNAEGQARKKAEVKAVKEAIDLVGQVISDGKQLLDEEGKFANTVVVPRATLKLVLLSQVKGAHISKYAYGGEKYKLPSAWLWDKVSAGTKEEKRNDEALFKAIDNWDDEELARLVVEMAFYYLTDKGDIGTYEIKATEPLKWMGVTIQTETTGGESDD